MTGGIFEPGFADVIQQMWAAYLMEREGQLGGLELIAMLHLGLIRSCDCGFEIHNFSTRPDECNGKRGANKRFHG